MLTLLFWVLTIVGLLIAIPLAEMVYSNIHKARREGNCAGIKALTSIFYVRPPIIVHEQESRQARVEYDILNFKNQISPKEENVLE